MNEFKLKIAGYVISLNVSYPVKSDYRSMQFLISGNDTADLACDVGIGELPCLQEADRLAETAEYVWYQSEDGRVFIQKGKFEGGWKTCFLHRKPVSQLIVNVEAEPVCNKLTDILAAADIGTHMLNAGIMMLHASYIVDHGGAILFTAPSGTGKTTQANLWREETGAAVINGDRALLLEKDGALYAAGLPFSGSSAYCFNYEAPVKGIVLLEQAPFNEICAASRKDALKFLFTQMAAWRWDRDQVEHVLDCISNVTEKTTIVRLKCLPNAEAVQMLKEYLDTRPGGDARS